MEEAADGLYLDGAHNPGGVEEFAAAAGRLCRERGKRAYLLFSAVSDKAHESMIRTIAQALAFGRRGCHPYPVGERAFGGAFGRGVCSRLRLPCNGISHGQRGARCLLSWQDGGHLLFCVGSLYLMGELKEILKEELR